MTAKPIFIGGTGSHVGKSWVATALCRYLRRKGLRVAPFKAQNMSNNSMVCPGGGEIGRAQVAQAEACGLSPQVDMNPILLKPTTDLCSQVVLNGYPWRTLTAREYYDQFDFLCEAVKQSYDRLASNYDYVVVEGAGSITELNLKRYDLVNLGLAMRIQAPCILVADIDRGGVFASVTGTFHLLEPVESVLVRTFLINRFRGDVTLFNEGMTMLESRTGRRCLGVFPYAENIHLDPEDSLSLDDQVPATANTTDVGHRVAIIRLPHISNFTDFRLLPGAHYVSQPNDERFDVIFLPGTKNTIEDMTWLRSSGLTDWMWSQYREGATIVGICGGFQMLGDEISDPDHVESHAESVQGLGLIRARTRLMPYKTTTLVAAHTNSGIPFQGYEIHMGITTIDDNGKPFAHLENGNTEGIRLPRITGTYLHGAFENKEVLEEVLHRRLDAALPDRREAQYERLADWFAGHVDKELFEAEYLRK
jgi:adenosylcobyric acid synthase